MTDPRYVFLDRHAPQLKAGAYTVHASVSPHVDSLTQSGGTLGVELWIGGERFAMAPGSMHSVYPPEGSRGDYGRCLPHIALARDTLPWERTADDRDTPWLALILLHADEAARARLESLTLGEYRKHHPGTKGPEPGQTDSDHLQVIHLDDALAKLLIPTRDELTALCHVRGELRAGALQDGVAVVVGKRAPGPGQNTVHLVSLEDRIHEGQIDLGANAPRCTLVSLKSWTFYSEPTAGPSSASMAALLQKLDVSWLRVPPPNRGAEAAEPYLARGRTPRPHRMRSGESGASWYAGPLLPGPHAEVDDGLVKLPAASADELLWYDEQLGMFDVSYAAAWELGRLLALERPAVAGALAAWRRQRVLSARAKQEKAANAHLPQLQRTQPESLAPPTVLVEWLDGLRNLVGIPFKYLVPDERMLPPESLRMFSVSARWLAALRDGALSLARPPGLPRSDAESALLAASPLVPRSGFLLRSALVSGWPGLQLDEVAPVGGVDSAELPSHQIGLSPSILLYLCSARVTSLIIRQHPSTVHFALRDGEGPFLNLHPGMRGGELAMERLDRAQALKLTITP